MTILFIHGFATGPAVWANQVEELSKTSAVLTDYKKIAEVGDDVIVVGWSMGGWKALDLYFEFPQKIKGLVLVAAFAKYLKDEEYLHGTAPVLLKKLEKKFSQDFRSGLHYFYSLMFKNGVFDHLIASLPEPEKKDLDRWFEKLKDEDKRAVLSEIKIPVLIIQGETDQVVNPSSAQYLHESIPNSQLQLLKGVGHAPMVESPVEFNLLLQEFIKSCQTKKR